VNVFLGRLNAYVIDNKLGDGNMVGEKATLASQMGLRKGTRQIAASLRGGSQVRDLAGVDVMTIPLATAADARAKLAGKWESRLGKDYTVSLASGVKAEEVRLSVAWEIGAKEKDLLKSLEAQPPATAAELVSRAHDKGLGELFPRLSTEDAALIASDGKIPKHARWADRIARGELAVDSLLNLAGLASFTADQKELDDRIRGLMG
jgi:transaldolase